METNRHPLLQPSLLKWSLGITLAFGFAMGSGILEQRPIVAIPTPASAQFSRLASLPEALPESIRQRLVKDLAARLNINPDEVQVTEVTSTVWPDACLGLARPNERCIGRETPGWRVILASSQQTWQYRTSQAGTTIKMEPIEGAQEDIGEFSEASFGEFTTETSRRLLKTVAGQVKRPPSTLKVLQVEPAVWSGCFGIFESNQQACTAIAIYGWRVIIGDGQQTWVYHLDLNAEKVIQNKTASGATAAIMTLFLSGQSEGLSFDRNVIFRSQLSGDLTGSVQSTVLMADGKLYREQSRGGNPPRRTLIKQLRLRQVKAFQLLLEQQKFPNLRRMRYLTQAAFADYPTTRLEIPGVIVDYVDLEKESLPAALQQVIVAWEKLQK
jgi:hypothetical protein